MRRLYFARHAQSENDVGPRYRDAFAPLTEHGKIQAEALGHRLLGHHIDCIFTSTMARAVETAKVVSDILGCSIYPSDLFIERRRPTAQYGQPKNSRIARHIDQQIYGRFGEPSFRYSDEENFEDLRVRARNCMDFLSSREEENILVITHGFFLRVMAAVALVGPDVSATQCLLFARSFHIENTGISIFMSSRAHEWTLWTWNDYAHLEGR